MAAVMIMASIMKELKFSGWCRNKKCFMLVLLSTLGRYQTPLKIFDRDCGMLFIQHFVSVH